MPKRGKLKDIHIEEMSLVDLPANKQPFLFFKQDGAKESQFVKAKKKITIGIESDGTGKGTTVTINGDVMKGLRDFNFSFYGTEKDSPVSCSYSKVVEAEDGFKRTESFYLSKGEIMNKKTLKALQEYLGKEDIDFEKKVNEEEIEKAITLIAKEYKEAFPEDLENAVGVIAKRAANSYAAKDNKDVEKAGARLSKELVRKLKAIIESLNSILPGEKESTEKSDSGGKNEELAKQVAELKETITKLSESADSEKKDVLKKALERIAALEKDGATKKSITGNENDNDEPKGAGKDGEILWKSFQPKKQ